MRQEAFELPLCVQAAREAQEEAVQGCAAPWKAGVAAGEPEREAVRPGVEREAVLGRLLVLVLGTRWESCPHAQRPACEGLGVREAGEGLGVKGAGQGLGARGADADLGSRGAGEGLGVRGAGQGLGVGPPV